MKKAVWLGMFLWLLLALNLVTFVPVVYAEEQGEEILLGLFEEPSLWEEFWSHSAWTLEYFNLSWTETPLDVELLFPNENRCKISLEWTAPYTTSYRLTFRIGMDIVDYEPLTNEYNLTYHTMYYNFTMRYNWADIAFLPSLQISQGIEQNQFWFRVQRDNVSEGLTIVLDPEVLIDEFTSGTSSTYIKYPHPSDTGYSAIGQCFNQTKTKKHKITTAQFYLKCARAHVEERERWIGEGYIDDSTRCSAEGWHDGSHRCNRFLDSRFWKVPNVKRETIIHMVK